MPSRIKHVAIMSQNAPRMFKFYECLFDLRRAASEATPALEAEHGRSFGYPILASKRVVSPFDRTVIASDGNIGGKMGSGAIFRMQEEQIGVRHFVGCACAPHFKRVLASNERKADIPVRLAG